MLVTSALALVTSASNHSKLLMLSTSVPVLVAIYGQLYESSRRSVGNGGEVKRFRRSVQAGSLEYVEVNSYRFVVSTGGTRYGMIMSLSEAQIHGVDEIKAVLVVSFSSCDFSHIQWRLKLLRHYAAYLELRVFKQSILKKLQMGNAFM